MDMIRPHPGGTIAGWIEVICGPMFSGKSEELIRRLRRAQIAKRRVIAFKPRIDDRYEKTAIASHSRLTIPCFVIDTPQEILPLVPTDTEVVGIDEIQFLGNELVEVVQTLADRGIRVICAGLDQDSSGVPWEPVPTLMALAEYVQKTLAICVVCGNPAGRTQRKTIAPDGDRVLVGEAESYEPRCRLCHTTDETIQTPELFPESDEEKKNGNQNNPTKE